MPPTVSLSTDGTGSMCRGFGLMSVWGTVSVLPDLQLWVWGHPWGVTGVRRERHSLSETLGAEGKGGRRALWCLESRVEGTGTPFRWLDCWRTAGSQRSSQPCAHQVMCCLSAGLTVHSGLFKCHRPRAPEESETIPSSQ